MAWIQPKTNWSKDDWINIQDFNRIKNNLQYLHEMSVGLYLNFSIPDLGKDKDYSDYPYAEDVNALEEALDRICTNTIPALAGVKKSYFENTATIDYAELNRIESCILRLHSNLTNQMEGRQKLAFTLGVGRRF